MLILSFIKLLSQNSFELFPQKHRKTIILFVVFIPCRGSMVRPLVMAAMPCCQSSWASAFENLLEAFNLTVTSNGAFVLFLCQLSVESSNHYAKATKLAIRKI